jgi:hypothetical protein
MGQSICQRSSRVIIKGFKPKLQTLDNEASATLKNYVTVNDILTNWCRLTVIDATPLNASFKEQFVPGLSSVDPYFQMHLWDILLPQAEITSWAGGLPQNSFCSARMQNHRTRKARQAESLGSSRSAWILTWSHHASLPVSKCIHLDNSQRPHRRYSRIISPQLSNATVIVHRPVTDGSRRHDRRLPKSSSRSSLRQHRG